MHDAKGENYKAIIGENLRFWRKFKGYSQEDIANHIGISRTYYTNLERGHAGVPLDTYQKIADFLGIYIDDILSYAPYRDMVLEVYHDKTLNPRLTEDELRNLLGIRFNLKNIEPTLNLFYFLLEFMRSERVLFQRKKNPF